MPYYHPSVKCTCMCVQMAVGPVLATCNQLSSSSMELSAIALRMMSSLWKQHDFCFPYLVQMLMSTASVVDADDGAVLLARAACMMDVCCIRYVELVPYQSGSSLSSSLSSDSNPEPAVNLSHGMFHSRLKTYIFSKSFPP